MPIFLVERRIRGHQELLVEAKNKKEAIELVKNGDPKVKGLDFEIDWHGKPYATLDE